MGEKMKLKIILSYILVIISGILLFSGMVFIEGKLLDYFYNTNSYWFIVSLVVSTILLLTVFYGTIFACSKVEDILDGDT